MMTIRLAKENDIEEIMGLITRTIISRQSSSGWNETYPTKEIFVKDIDNQFMKTTILSSASYLLFPDQIPTTKVLYGKIPEHHP